MEKKLMDMRRLEVFCKVVELKSFTKAAEALRLSQPTASEHIRTLEQILGEKMIDRLGREVLPTPAGRVFYQYARNIVQMRDEAIEALDQFKGKLGGHLILGASTIPGAYFLPKFIASFKAAHPSVRITLRISDTAEVSNDVLQGSASVGVVGSRPNDRRLVLEKLFSDELVLAVYPEHPWTKKRKIDLDELDGEPFILREVGSGTRSVMSRMLQELGFDTSRLEVVAEMGSTEAVRQGIKAGIGVSILSYQAVAEDFDHGLLSPVKINDMRLTRPLYLIQRKNRQPSPVASAFTDYLRKQNPWKQ
jgi:DNA-binding transcriptional LysR family regulator